VIRSQIGSARVATLPGGTLHPAGWDEPCALRRPKRGKHRRSLCTDSTATLICEPGNAVGSHFRRRESPGTARRIAALRHRAGAWCNLWWTVCAFRFTLGTVIVSFRHARLRELFETGKSRKA
jgi:hypothetical protein